MRSSAKLVWLLSAPCFFLLFGCGVNLPSTRAPVTGSAITGKVFGGQQPIVGAAVYLLAAGTGGYGGASASLLTNHLAGTSTIGGYVLTGAGGSFNITSDYTCTPGQQTYRLVLGGDPNGDPQENQPNTAIGLMAALGECPGSDTLSTTYPNVVINEVTTIATAYALAGYATDAEHISSSGSSQAITGVSNALLTAANLVNVTVGTANSSTAVGGGTVPQAEINTLANILAACVNSVGPSSNTCSALFSAALSGGATGTKPADTATAAINIAHHPGANVGGLWSVLSGVAAQFQPVISVQPNDFTIGIVWPIGSNGLAFDAAGNLWTLGANGLLKYSNNGQLLSPAGGYTSTDLPEPYLLAIDPSNNVWVTNYSINNTANYITKLSNTGTVLSPSGGYANNGLNGPNAMAIDGTGDVWIGNANAATVSAFNNMGQALPNSPFASGGYSHTGGLVIDNTGSVWVSSVEQNSNLTFSTLQTKLNSSGALIAADTFNGGGTSYSAFAIDANNNVWGSAQNQSTFVGGIFELNSSGVQVPNSPFAGNDALDNCLFTAVDGLGNVWCDSDSNGVAEMSNAGTPISPANGYIVANAYGPESIAIDNSGNVWTTTDYYLSSANIPVFEAVELVGAAAPIITPLSQAIAQGKLGTLP